jgi:UPF0716 protein FxsA
MLAWPVAEIVAFVAVASTFGFFEAVLLVVLSSLLGVVVLRQFGGTAQRVRDGVFVATAFGEGMGPVLAGLLLLIPGFVSSAVGVLVLLPVTRGWLIALLKRLLAGGAGGPSSRSSDPDVIDLAPEEWQPLPGETLPPADNRRVRSGDDRAAPKNPAPKNPAPENPGHEDPAHDQDPAHGRIAE